jgi:hypothetical protein
MFLVSPYLQVTNRKTATLMTETETGFDSVNWIEQARVCIG